MTEPQLTAQEENERLRLRIADLEKVLKQTNGSELALAFHLPPVMEKLLGLLLAMPLVTGEMVERRLDISTQPKIAVYRLREYLKRHAVDVKCKRNVGWWIEPDDKTKLMQIAARSRPTPQVNEEQAPQ